MFVSYFSPLAPAAVLLLGAFILAILPGLPGRWQFRLGISSMAAPLVVGTAFVSLLALRVTSGPDPTGQGVDVLSGWSFADTGSAAALTIRADTLSLVFLILVLLFLLAVTLAHPANAGRASPDSLTFDRLNDVWNWLLVASAACLLFVSANGLTLGYAIFFFDLLTALYWLKQGRSTLATARIFLGVITATGLALTTLNTAAGSLPLSFALWLRIGLFPLLELNHPSSRTQPEQPALPLRNIASNESYSYLVYLALTLAAGLYLFIRTPLMPMPAVMRWLFLLTALTSGILNWLSIRRRRWLVHPVLTQILLIFAADLTSEVAIAVFTVGIILSMTALWVTPRLGRPDFTQSAWLWPYFPALGATLTLVGVPFSLGSAAHQAVYRQFFSVEAFSPAIGVGAAQALAFSGLVYYWRDLWQGNEIKDRRSVASVVVMVPFLIPGLAPFVLLVITGLSFSPFPAGADIQMWLSSAAVIVTAIGLAIFQARFLQWLNLSPERLENAGRWGQNMAWPHIEGMCSKLGKLILRLDVILQGQHYLGWAIFTALIGAVIFLLGT